MSASSESGVIGFGAVDTEYRKGKLTPAPPPLGGSNLRLVQAEIVRHFVPHGILHQPGKVLGAAGEALVRALKDGDAVGHGERLEDAALGERAAFVEPQQSAPPWRAPAGQLRRPRLGFHY